jgi:drug/metabolite transporter (DMT)-like permease
VRQRRSTTERRSVVAWRGGLPIAIPVTLIVWASAFVGIRMAMREYSPGELALVRFAVASLTLAAFSRFAPGGPIRLPQRRDLLGLLVMGFVGISCYHVTLNAGERTVSAGSASLIASLNPIFTSLIALIWLGERLKLRAWTGVLIGFAGAALVAAGESRVLSLEPGAGLVLASALFQAIYFVMQKPYFERYRPLEVTAYVVWSGTLCLMVFLPGAWHAVQTTSVNATLAAVYLGVVPGALGYVTWSYVLSRMPAGKATSFLYLVPPLVVIIAWAVLDERPAGLSLLGGAVALAGVALVNVRRAEPRREVRTTPATARSTS